MSLDLAQIETRLRMRICPTCVRYTSDHRCSLPHDRPCSLFKNLERIVGVVRKTNSPLIDPYVEGVRADVCAACVHEDGHGSCPMRADLDCALDTYLPIIVDEVERDLTELRQRRGA